MEEIRTYEIACLVSEPDKALRVEELIRQTGGVILASEQPREIALAYPIEKRASAYFFYCDFTLDPGALNALQRELRLASLSIRFLIVTPPPVKHVPRSERRAPLSQPASPPASGESSPLAPDEGVKSGASNEDLQAALSEIER
ncbi:MAG: 30S ribosomal protein S6 [Candidatus Colwellbacteria bacterium]|nr:30S ribosomal protein S6 [Candidatus Colwellbacteria bacterium]